MRVKRAIIILLGLLLLMGTVTAYYADPASSSFLPSDSTKTWIVADIGQQNVIKMVAYNNTPGYAGPIKNTPVTFSIDNPILGTITPANPRTDNNGEALCTFNVNTTQPTSGTVKITADIVSYEDGTSATYHTLLIWDQNIDHNIPYKAVFTYDNLGAVESVMPVEISFFDRWDNPIDDRFETQYSLPLYNVTLHVNGPSPPNDCGFTDYGGVHDKTIDLNSNGIVDVDITPATKPGWHYILMDTMGNIPEQMKLFNTVANGVPFSMTQSFSPDGEPYATVITDGTSKFTFYYTLYDRYRNPTQDQWVRINISVLEGEGSGEERLRESMENGQIWSTYGPKSFTGLYTIDATAEGNTSLKLSKVVRFYNTTPSDLDLSANPQSMPSRDANPSIYSNISAKVVDIMGNGVEGEEVTFTFHDVTNTPTTATVTTAPSFSSTGTVITTSATTDSNGYATVKFYPSSYATVNQPGYLQAVTGTAKITATWNGNQKDEPVTWKNYPYLSAIVAVNPQQIQVGDMVNVSLTLNGDGWALYRYPVDVDLVLDRSGSMDWDINGGYGTPTRLSIAQAAAKNFIGSMSASWDRLGLFSFSSASSVSHDASLQSPFNPVVVAVDGLSAGGATAMRPALKQAIDDLKTNPNGNTKAVQAVIVMTDGNWNNEGSPAAHGIGWPEGSSYYTFSGSSLEPDNYRYYPSLGGTLTPFTSTTCSVYSTTVCDEIENTCDMCEPGYSLDSWGRCCSGSGKSKVCHYPDTDTPSWCSQKHCNAWHCDEFATENQCTDGEFTNQNLSIYAKNNKIRLYFIFFAGTPDATAESTLKTMAEATGGFYQKATNADELNDAYNRIAGDLITEAGVDTMVTLDFGQLIVNNALAAPGTEILSYVGDPSVAAPVKGVDFPTIEPGSTMLDKYNKTPSGEIGTHFIPGTDVDTGLPFANTGPIIINQTNYWNTHSQKLAFRVDTVNINETWKADFRFRVLTEGNILIFGPDSKVCFTNGEAGDSCMTLPNLSLSSSTHPLNIGVSETAIILSIPTRTDSGSVTGTLPVSWTTDYNGAEVITEDVSYIHEDDPPVKFDTKTLNKASGDLNAPQSSVLDMEKLPPGGYKIQVYAYTKDASATAVSETYSFTTQGRAFIKLE